MSRSELVTSSPRQHVTCVAWQGWRIDLPARWSPVKLEGDYDRGYALFADLHRPRLGIRWQKAGGKKFDADTWTRKAMRNEVGKLAADEAVAHPAPASGEWQSSLLYVEPEPPGRDVWIACSKTSNRALELIHHAHRRERILADTIIPTVVDLPSRETDVVPWSIFDLSLRLPGTWRLSSQRLNAGDLSLTFTKRRNTLVVRQIAVAELALKRQPLSRWLDQQERSQRRYYRAMRETSDVSITTPGGRSLVGMKRRMTRRRRYIFLRWLPATVTTFVLHDASRDRLVFVQGTDEAAVEAVIPTIGWASD